MIYWRKGHSASAPVYYLLAGCKWKESGDTGNAMLVLSRKVGERILIGENIVVTVVRIAGGGVRLGIEAPLEMPVVREELKQKLEEAEAEQESADIEE